MIRSTFAVAFAAAVTPALLAQEVIGSDSTDPVPSELLGDLHWRSIGPYRGGRVTAVTGVPSKPFTFYMGATGGGVWKTDDGGTRWRNVSDGFLNTVTIGALAVAPSDENVVYVGTGEAQVRGVTTSHGDGVYRSNDGGASWRHLGLELTRHIAAIRVHPTDPDTVWVAAQGDFWRPSTERGVYRSTDGGTTWERVFFVDESSGCSSLALDPTNPRVLYAGMWDHQRTPWQVRSGGQGSGIHKSTDGGTTWSELTVGLPDLMGKIGIDVSPRRPSRLWAIVEAEEGGLFRSDDSGSSWRRVSADRVLRARAWYYTRVFADPLDADTVYVLNAPVLRSVDGGESFDFVGTPHGDNHALWIHPEHSEWMINGNDGGANVSYNGGSSWSTQSNQPTAQFYRVITDDQFPYRVYGGQQDNSSVSIASRTSGNGIGREDWYPAGGGESAYLAFDPQNPRLVYAGVYQGLISEYDTLTRRGRDIMAVPYLGLGSDPKDLPYRFNWNAPIVASPFDPATIYHAGNQLLVTRDRGATWTELSPDLTRDEEDKQGKGGAPITNEAAGAETYNTILSLEPSPHEEGTIWCGSDDGLVHLTRDGGTTWSNVTPSLLAEGGIGEAMINAIGVSPHDPATAYLAVTRYKFGDLTPHVFVTNDWGASWSRRVSGIPDEAYVRVVREDPVRRGLLFAGTEAGVFVSVDNGERWQSLQLDLPRVPITDLEIRRDGDLVAATQGRGFWILDDVSPLRQMVDVVLGAELALFAPRPAYRFEGGGWQRAPEGRGQNPPSGATLYYLVGEDGAGDRALALEIVDDSGAALARFTSERGRLSEQPGLHRIVWDLRRDPIETVPGQFTFGSPAGHRVAPGLYRVRMSWGEHVLEHPLRVLDDPRLRTGPGAYDEQQELLAALRVSNEALNRAVVRLRDVRSQLRTLLARELPEPVTAAANALAERLTEWERSVVQVEQETFQDVINFPNLLNAEMLDLASRIDSAGADVTRGMRELAAELGQRWEAREAVLETLIGDEVDAFNALYRASELPAVHVRPGGGE